FRGWPDKPGSLSLEKVVDLESDGIAFSAYDFLAQEPWNLRLFVAHRKSLPRKKLDLVVLNVLDEKGWTEFAATYGKSFSKAFEGYGKQPKHDTEALASEKRMFKSQSWAMAYLAPRGIGPTAWSGDARKLNHLRRRFYLLGQTLDGMRVHDVVRSAQALREIDGLGKTALWMQAHGHMAGNVLYASLFTPEVTRLDLHDLPATHMEGPAYLNVLRHLDIPQAVALAVERTRVILYQPDAKYDPFPAQVVDALGLGKKAYSVRESLQE
ncbi:MAG: hypothetical protein AAEJ57_01515, partial [Opitutales bacterium]